MMKLGSLFDGSGTAPLAAAMCGIEPVWASEIEPYPIKVTKARFPNMLHLGDITKINGAEVEPVDIICGGSPCQDLSVAGKQKGLQDGERSHLFFEMTRIIKQMREATNGKYPRYIIWENVPGAFSSNKGKDFHAVLQAFAEIADPDVYVPEPESKADRLVWKYAGEIMGDGWSVAWRTVDAQYWGVPQRRRRIYLVADLTGECAGEVLFERTGLSGDSAQGREAREETARDAGSGVDRSGGTWSLSAKQQSLATECETGATLGANDFKEPQCIVCLNDQGGNVMSVSYDCTATLRAQEHGHQPVVAGFVGRQGAKSGSVGFEEGISPTLRQGITTDVVYDARGNGDGGTVPTLTGDHQNRVSNYTAICVGNGQLHNISMAEQMNTLDCMHDQQAILTNGKPPRKYIIRRLTPLECCRLQGFPDWWEDGVEGSDSARYKMWGNGMALPNMLHVMKGIVKIGSE
jgi:DNA (cytosine-5)-methyltransferase 1